MLSLFDDTKVLATTIGDETESVLVVDAKGYEASFTRFATDEDYKDLPLETRVFLSTVGDDLSVPKASNETAYHMWLTQLGGGGGDRKLTWKERSLGKEVPASHAGVFFDQAKQDELQRLADEKVYKTILRKDARNLVSARFVLRWKPIKKGPTPTGEFKSSARFVAHGFRDLHWWLERAAPTARKENRRLGISHSLAFGWRIHSLDATRAFLQTRVLNRVVCIEPPKEAGVAGDSVWQLLRPLYGLNDAAKKWCDWFLSILVGRLGGRQVPGDKCTILFFESDGTTLAGWVSVHVDDTMFSSKSMKLCDDIRGHVKCGDIESDCFLFAGVEFWTVFQNGTPVEIHESQEEYTKFLEEMDVSSSRKLDPTASATEAERSAYRGVLGGLLWVTSTRWDLAHECSLAASKVNELTVQDCLTLNKLVRKAKVMVGSPIIHRALKQPWAVVAFGDSNQDPAAKRTFQGTAVFLAERQQDLEAHERCEALSNLIIYSSRKATRSLTSSLSAEVHGAVTAFDHGRWTALMLEAFAGRDVRPVLEPATLRRFDVKTEVLLLLYLDCESLIKHLLAESAGMLQERRFLGYVAVLEGALMSGDIAKVFHVASKLNLADVLTKAMFQVAWELWRNTGRIKVEPGEYSGRAEARRAAKRALEESKKRNIHEDYKTGF